MRERQRSRAWIWLWIVLLWLGGQMDKSELRNAQIRIATLEQQIELLKPKDQK